MINILTKEFDFEIAELEITSATHTHAHFCNQFSRVIIIQL